MRLILSAIIALFLISGCRTTDPNYFRQIEANPAWWQQKRDSINRIIEQDGLVWPGPVEYSPRRAFEPPYSVEASFDILLNTSTFSSSFVGIAGSPSDQAIAFNVVLEGPNAQAAFHDLLKRATPAGKLYALSGLYLTDIALFEEQVDRYAEIQDSVWTHSGCVVGQKQVGRIVQHPDGIRLADDQTIDEWYRETYGSDWRLAEPAENHVFDIAGGAWPNEFRRVREHIRE